MSDYQSRENPPLIVVNPDGSCTRNISVLCSPPTPDQDTNTSVLSKDVTINQITNTLVRIYLPKQSLTTTRTPVKKLPLIVCYHGGGFVLSSVAETVNHDFCNQMAAHLSSMVVAVGYRLAPEHRLPAAYDDGVAALHWLKSTNDPWLINFADLSNCYLMGTSAGANLVYHAGLRVSQQLNDLNPLKIKGLVLHNLFIGGVERMGSEIQLADVGRLNLSTSDTMWDLSLPVGSSRDHEYCNLMAGDGQRHMDRIKDAGWMVMMAIRYGDFMVDRQMEFAKSLKLKGVETHCYYGEGDHGIDMFDKSKAKELFDEISCFMSMIPVK